MSLRVYLAVPIVGGRDIETAGEIAEVIRRLGHQVVSPWVLSLDPGRRLPPEKVFKRDKSAVESCDVLVAETSTPSHGVGMEIAIAYLAEKKIVCLLRKGRSLSGMVRGVPGITVVEYEDIPEIEGKLSSVLP